MGSFDIGIPGIAQSLGAPLVGHENQDIRPVAGGGLSHDQAVEGQKQGGQDAPRKSGWLNLHNDLFATDGSGQSLFHARSGLILCRSGIGSVRRQNAVYHPNDAFPYLFGRVMDRLYQIFLASDAFFPVPFPASGRRSRTGLFPPGNQSEEFKSGLAWLIGVIGIHQMVDRGRSDA